MATTPDLALLALRVYATKGSTDGTNIEFNRPAIPAGWIELEWHSDNVYGFSYGVYQNGSEIVISFAGTNEYRVDGASDVALAAGLGSPQLTQVKLRGQVSHCNKNAINN